MRVAWTPAIRHQLRFAIAVVAVSAGTGWMLFAQMAGLIPFVILIALANAIRPHPRASRDTTSTREQAVAVAVMLALVGLAVGGYYLDPAQTTLSWWIGAMLVLMCLLMLYACTRDAAATLLDSATPAARDAPVPVASMIRHQARFAIAVLAITVSFWLASSVKTQFWYATPYLLAVWITPAPPRPEHDWSRRAVLPMLLFLAVMGLVVFALSAAGEDSPFTTWTMRLLFLGAWPLAMYAFARDAAATFPGSASPTLTSEPLAP